MLTTAPPRMAARDGPLGTQCRIGGPTARRSRRHPTGWHDGRRVAEAGEFASPEAPRFVDPGPVESEELRDVTAYVGAVRIEPMPLARGAEYPVGVRARASSGHPLPVQVVECDVSVDEVFEEMPSAVAPVQPEVPGEERRRRYPGAVRKETFERQLPHRCVDDWHAGEASAPCLESRWVPTGPTTPFDVVGPRCLGSRCEDLEVKVTPTQLPQERPRPWQAVNSSLDLERGETAEVQVPREPGVRRLGEVVPVLAVAGDPSAAQVARRVAAACSPPWPTAGGCGVVGRAAADRDPGHGSALSTVGSEVGGGRSCRRGVVSHRR